MGDLISRAGAIKAICEDGTKLEQEGRYILLMASRKQRDADILSVLPTVDAVPVVRCKDCKYSEHWYKDKRRCFLWVKDGIDVFNDGFCNYGERKDGEKHG